MPSADDPSVLLRELECHPVARPSLLSYVPATEGALAAMPASEREARAEAQRRAVQTTVGWQRAREVVSALGRARYAPSAKLLARLWRHSLIVPLRIAAGHALFDIGTEDAHAALQASLEDVEPHGHLPTFLAIKSLVATRPVIAFDRLAPYFERRERAVVYAALYLFAPSTLGTPKAWHLTVIPELLRSDRRWLRTAVKLRRDDEFGPAARGVLKSLTTEEMEAALHEVPDAPDSVAPPYDGPRDLPARYARGEHAEVWTWLRRPGVGADPEMRAQARAVATLTMDRVRQNVQRLTAKLAAGGYPFDTYLPSWAPPKATVREDIRRIESAAAGPIPLTLDAFWTIVGEVNWKFTEDPDVPAIWRGLPLREADPLCCLSPRDAWFAIEEWQRELALAHPEAVGPPTLRLAPDYLHKANISGGAAYGFTIPNDTIDALFENEAHALPFVDYLRLGFRWGGFPGLENQKLSDEGRRTLAELIEGLEPF